MSPSKVVLDTNVLLDWLVFGEPSARPWVSQVQTGAWQWIFSASMQEEFKAVLQYPQLQTWGRDTTAIWNAWATWGHEVSPGPTCNLRCTDPDDQKFIDLALTHGATWLLTKDRALLKLAKRARPWHLTVCTPATWAAGEP